MSKKDFVGVLEIIENRQLQVSILLSSLIFLIPFFVHQQFLTGPIINALLILSLLYLGKSQAFFLALIPSSVALSRGLLPLSLAPMVPFIMISNCLYIEAFARLTSVKQNHGFLAVFVASLLKTIFLFLISKLLMENILAAPLASKIAVMMSWPQLWTALLGGVLALLIDQGLKKGYVSR